MSFHAFVEINNLAVLDRGLIGGAQGHVMPHLNVMMSVRCITADTTATPERILITHTMTRTMGTTTTGVDRGPMTILEEDVVMMTID